MSEDNILGAILAGGQSKRMGQDKFFLQLNGKTLIEYSINKVKKHLQKVIIIKNLEFEIKDYDPFFNINTTKDLEFAKKLSTKLENEKK
jgi:molybdopterin-guanine dinucleotide biosynthesis protein A